MGNYRFYCLDRTGRISLAEWIEANTDDEALVKASGLKGGAIKCEVWEDDRLVARLNGAGDFESGSD